MIHLGTIKSEKELCQERMSKIGNDENKPRCENIAQYLEYLV